MIDETDRSGRRPRRSPRVSARQRLVALMAVLALVAVACTGDDASDTTADAGDSGDNGDADTTVADGGDGDSSEGAELEVWISRDFYVPGDEFASFEEETGIGVTYDVVPDDDILQRLQRARDADQPLPDVIHDDGFLQPTYHQLDFLHPLGQCLERWEEEDPDNFNAIPEQQWEDGSVDGEVVGMPYGTAANFLFYNIPWFEDGGVEAPFQTWDGLLDAAGDLKDARPDGYPYALQALEGEGVNAQLMMMGGMNVPFENAVPQLDTEAGLYILDFYKEMADQGITNPEAIAHGENETRGNFLSGRAALLIDSVSAFDDFEEPEDYNYGEHFGVTPLPVVKSEGGEEGVNYGTSRHYHIVSETEHPEEACDLFQWLMQTEQILGIVEVGGSPTRQSDAIYSDRMVELLPFFEDDSIKEAYLDMQPVPTSDQFGDIEDVLEQLFAEIAVGTDKTAQELADEYQPQLDEAGSGS